MNNGYDLAVASWTCLATGACAGGPRSTDAVTDIALTPGRHVTVDDDDADPKVARVLSVDADGNIELEVLQGSVESHHDPLTPV